MWPVKTFETYLLCVKGRSWHFSQGPADLHTSHKIQHQSCKMLSKVQTFRDNLDWCMALLCAQSQCVLQMWFLSLRSQWSSKSESWRSSYRDHIKVCEDYSSLENYPESLFRKVVNGCGIQNLHVTWSVFSTTSVIDLFHLFHIKLPLCAHKTLTGKLIIDDLFYALAIFVMNKPCIISHSIFWRNSYLYCLLSYYKETLTQVYTHTQYVPPL